MNLPERFWDKLERITESGCWIWMGAINKKGYGRFLVSGKNRLAHRVSYQALVGSIPDGLYLDHLCRVSCCVNPDHLEPVTNAVNVLRGWKARGKKTHCINGHAIDGITNSRRRSYCRRCELIAKSDPETRARVNATARAKWKIKHAT